MTDTGTTTESRRQAMIDKVAALLNKTTSKGCTDEEAQAAAEAAQRLMAKYAIDEAMLSAAGKSDDKLDSVFVEIASSYFNPRLFLLDAIAKSNDCRVLYTRGGSKKGAYVKGFKSDLDNVLMMYTNLVMHMQLQARRYNVGAGAWDASPYKQRESFMMGYQREIGRRLKEARRFAESQAKTQESAGSNSVALVLVSKAAQVDQYVGRTKAGKLGGGSYDGRAGMAGAQAGRNADLGGTRLGGHKAIGGR